MADPPAELCFGASDTSYDRIWRIGKVGREGYFSEQAYYGGEPEMRFLHKAIGVGRFEFYYRQLKIEPGEKAYAIQIRPLVSR